MAKRQPVAEFSEDAAGVCRSVGMWNSVMQMDLDFSPASVAVIGEHLKQPLVVLLSGIEVGVNERAAVVVAPVVGNFGIFAHPRFQAALLFGARDALLAVFGIDRRFEMIGQGKDQMHRAADGRFQRTPGRGRPDLSGVVDLFLQSHLKSGLGFLCYRVGGRRRPSAPPARHSLTGLRPRTAMESSPTRMSSMPIASGHLNTCAEVCLD